MIKEIKQIRADLMVIEGLLLTVKDSRETSTAYTHLQEARMGCGNLIKLLDPESNPYPNSHNPTNKIIEPVHIDQEIEPMPVFDEIKALGKIELVKYLRAEIESRVQELKSISGKMLGPYNYIQCAFACNSLVMSKNWLGMELGRLRDIQNDFGA